MITISEGRKRVLAVIALAPLVFVLLVALQGCRTCFKSRDLPVTTPTQVITHNDVVIKAATLPNGTPSKISIEDKFPGQYGDGSNEIVVGWSQTATTPATINFPADVFGDGPSRVWVTCSHYNSCELIAFDKNNNQRGSAAHDSGQGVVQVLFLGGGKIRRIDIRGAEISIFEVCYRR